jgi:hypothetical protein
MQNAILILVHLPPEIAANVARKSEDFVKGNAKAVQPLGQRKQSRVG